MDESLKQRLVGALVLVSAAVIFLPLIFDGREEQDTITTIEIPSEPVVTLDVSEPKMDLEPFEKIKEKVEADRAAVSTPKEPLNSVAVANGEASTDQPEPERPVAKSEPAKQAAKKTVAKIQEQAKAPKQGTDRLSEAYSIQLAAFSSKENAEKLYKRLIAKKYAAYIQKGSSNGKTLYRVFVGPEIRKNRALIIAEALKKEFDLKGMVVRYAP